MIKKWLVVLFVKPIDHLFIFLVWVYKIFVSPLKPKTCRFIPTCSTYMIYCIREHHFAKGILLGLRRLARCNPKNSGGWDPVPPNIKGEIRWML